MRTHNPSVAGSSPALPTAADLRVSRHDATGSNGCGSNKGATRLRNALNLIVATAIATAVLVPTLTAERPVPEGGFVAHNAIEASQAHTDKPRNVPTWSPAYAARFAGCAAEKPAGVPRAVLAVVLDGSVHRVATNEAWGRVKAGDFWVVGFCR